MIPESIPPNQAPGGVVAIAFDLDGNEITRSLVSADRVADVDWLATDAGSAVHDRGGGNLVVFDGDDGGFLFRGPVVRLRDGEREPVTHHVNDLLPLAEVIQSAENGWPWRLVGVFATEDDPAPTAWWSAFVYTSGLGDPELWVPSASIEGRYAGPQLIGSMLNFIASGWAMGVIQCGDTVIIPLGVPDADDIDTVWWIGREYEQARKRQVFQTGAHACVPILWSSGLGWP